MAVAKGLSEFFESPRRRRRAIVLTLIAAAAATVALLIAFARNTAPSQETKMTNAKPVVSPGNPVAVRLTPHNRKVVLGIAREFLDSGVAHHHFKRSWDLTTSNMHYGFTRKSWGPDNSTLVPFHYESARWRLDHAYSTEVGLEVALYPKPHDKDYPSPMVFDVVLSKTHAAKSPWLVSYWAPAPGSAQVVQSNTPPNKLALSDKADKPTQLSSLWLVAPAIVFLLILLIPITIGVREWRRGRRAKRAYESTLPSLSGYTSSSKPS